MINFYLVIAYAVILGAMYYYKCLLEYKSYANY